MPDLFANINREFIFYNLPKNGIGAAVTLQASYTQPIAYTTQYHILNPGDTVTLVADAIAKTWLISDINSGGYLALPILLGDNTSGIKIAADGNLTLLGTAKSWIDEIGDVIKLQQQGIGVSTNATESSVEFVTAANLSDYLYFNVQLNHNRYLASAINFHIHFWQANNNMPNFLIKYRYQTNGTAKTNAWTNLKCNTPAFTYASGTLNQIAFSASINPVNAGLSDIVQLQVFRDNSNSSGVFSGSDPYTGTVSITSIDCHFQVDGFGSNNEYAK